MHDVQSKKATHFSSMCMKKHACILMLKLTTHNSSPPSYPGETRKINTWKLPFSTSVRWKKSTSRQHPGGEKKTKWLTHLVTTAIFTPKTPVCLRDGILFKLNSLLVNFTDSFTSAYETWSCTAILANYSNSRAARLPTKPFINACADSGPSIPALPWIARPL